MSELSPLALLCSRLTARLLPLFVAASALACSVANDSASGIGGFAGAGGSAGDGGGGAGTGEPLPDSLEFVPDETVVLAPKEIQKLTVQTSPAGRFRVRFALLGTSSDAVLDTSEVETDSDGVAQVTLTAPSKPTTFTLRASVGSRQVRRGVSVTSLGETRLVVRPAYSGRRTITEWTASVTAAKLCGDLGNPPPDGDLVVSAPPTEPLAIEHVPIGVDLAVTLRAGHYIGGCLDLRGLSEGDGNQALVYASDRPLNLEGTALDVAFGPSDSRPDFDRLLKGAASSAEAALVGPSNNDVTSLLDQMSAPLVGQSLLDFDQARLENTWDDKLTSEFGKSGARRLRDPAARWFAAGLARFSATDTFAGTLTPQGVGARLQLANVAGLTPSQAGFTAGVQATWSADSSDTLLLGSELSFVPSVLITSLASAKAALEVPAAVGPADALATLVDCARVAQVLVTYSASPGAIAYPSCDEACAAASCRSAVAALWQRAASASGTGSAALSLTASGNAGVGDDAQATGFKGSWLGELRLGGETAPASGAFSASAP